MPEIPDLEAIRHYLMPRLDGLTVTSTTGAAQTVRRPGFAITVPGPGAAPSSPFQAPPTVLAQFLSRIDGRPGGTGGARCGGP